MKILYLIPLIIISCVQTKEVTFEDYIKVLISQHNRIKTNTTNFIKAKNYLQTDKANSEKIYSRLTEIQTELNSERPIIDLLVYGVVPVDTVLYKINVLPTKEQINRAINTIIKSQIENISFETKLRSWQLGNFEENGKRLFLGIQPSNLKQLSILEKEVLLNNYSTNRIKYICMNFLLENKSEIDYVNYARQFKNIESTFIKDFILLFEAKKHQQELSQALKEEEKIAIENRLLTMIEKSNNANSKEEFEQAIKIVTHN